LNLGRRFRTHPKMPGNGWLNWSGIKTRQSKSNRCT